MTRRVPRALLGLGGMFVALCPHAGVVVDPGLALAAGALLLAGGFGLLGSRFGTMGARPAAWLGLALGPLPLAATGLFWIPVGPAPRGGVLLALVLAASGVVPLVVATAALARSGAAVLDVPRWLCVLPLVAAVLDLPVNLLLVHHLETPGLSLLGVTYLAFALAME